MLKILMGTDWVANRDLVLKSIAADADAGKKNIVLLVPELISHDMERRLCRAVGDRASACAQVLSFSRLVSRVSEERMIAPEKCLDNGGRLVAMAAAVRQLVSKLKAYAGVETRPEFLAGLVDAVDEFKRCCITPADMMLAATQCEGSLAQKLEELSLILEAYDSVCARGKRDPREQMNWVLEQMECCNYAQDRCFYIDGFPDFTRQHANILDHLIRNSPDVTVSLNCDHIHTQEPAFETAARTAGQLVRMAKEAGIAYRIIQVPSAQKDPLRCLTEKLFQGTVQEMPGAQQVLKAWHCDSEYDECTVAAEQVLELVRGGCRYRDIAVVCGDMEKYRGLLRMVFRRCGIPLYLSGTDDILKKSTVNTVLLALEAALDGFEQSTVLRYLRSSLSALDMDLCDKLENYAVIWGVRGKLWLSDFTWNPAGLGKEMTPEDTDLLSRLNGARKLAIEPLAHLRDDLRNARALKEQVAGLYAFLERIGYADRLEQLAAEAEQRGDGPAAQELLQLWEILIGALEQLYDLLGDTAWDPDSFQRLLRLLLSRYDVGTIPPVLDSVTAGPVSSMRCQQSKHLLVLGASEGHLPSCSGSAGVLTDQERVELRRLGVPLTGGAMEGVSAEFSEIYGVFCGARESIRISCAGNHSAFVMRRLCRMAGITEVQSAEPGPGAALADPWEAGAYLARFGRREEAGALGVTDGYTQASESAGYTLGAIDPERIRALYGKRLMLSASQIDQQAECRLGYFLRYGLKLQERKELSVDPAEFGSYVHAVLEQTARDIKAMGGWHHVDLDTTMEIAHRYSDAYAAERFSQLGSERMQYLFRRNGMELDAVVEELWHELSNSRFEPTAFELHFSENSTMREVPTPGKTMDAALQGYVDRVDRWSEEDRNYFRVVDYKTGKKDFDYCDVYNGVGLQMLLYLFALQRNGQDILGNKPVSAGVQYFPARFPFVNADGRLTEEEAAAEREKELRRRGLILADEAVIRAMEPGDEIRRLNCGFKSDGSITGDVATRDQMKLVEEYVFHTVGELVDQIASGKVDPNPYTRGTAHSACAFCPYSSVCRLFREAGRRNYKKMKADEFWNALEREVGEDG